MNGNTNGWVCLYRQLMESAVWQDEGLLKVWIWCLLRANHEEVWVPMTTGRGKTIVHLLPGQFVTGRDSAAKEISQKPTSIRNRLLRLKKLGNLDIQTDTHWSVVTVCNWNTYQTEKKKDGQASGQATDRQLTGNGQATDTDNNDNNENNENTTALPPDGGDLVPDAGKKPNRKRTANPNCPKPDSDYRRFTDYFVARWSLTHGNEKYPWSAADGPAAAAIWKHVAEDLDKARRIVDRYMACIEPFFLEHTMAKLRSHLARFLSELPTNGTNTNRKPAQTGDILPPSNFDHLADDPNHIQF